MDISHKELKRIIREEVMLHEGIAGTQWWIEVIHDDGRTAAYGPFASEDDAEMAVDDYIVLADDKTWEFTELSIGQQPQAEMVDNFDSLDEVEDDQRLEFEGAIKEAIESLRDLRGSK